GGGAEGAPAPARVRGAVGGCPVRAGHGTDHPRCAVPRACGVRADELHPARPVGGRHGARTCRAPAHDDGPGGAARPAALNPAALITRKRSVFPVIVDTLEAVVIASVIDC